MGTCEQYGGPGPAGYSLPTLTGYRGHDISKKRAPAFSMRKRIENVVKGEETSFYIIDNVTKRGKETPRTHFFGRKVPPKAGFSVPGPGTYSPEKHPYGKSSPHWVMGRFTKEIKPLNVANPSPNQYLTNPTVGSNHPMFSNAPAFSLYPRDIYKGNTNLDDPGPANYYPQRIGHPRGAKILQRIPYVKPYANPSPAQYNVEKINLHKKSPQYSFGMRLSPCSKSVPPKTKE